MLINQRWFIILLFLSGSKIFAQEVQVSPVPQSISRGAYAFNNNSSFRIQGDATADGDAVKLLKDKLKIGLGDIELIIGEKGDDAVASYVQDIPEKKEAYFLKIEPKRVVIAGYDSSGTYYGVQTFLQLMAAPKVMQATIQDYPDVPERGVVEGFYGNPFSHQDRLRQFEFYGENKMNVYLYGPKDDPYHGFGKKWRDPYPAEDGERMRQLIQAAHANKVQFVWAVHPGNDIHWNYADSIATIKKFEAMYSLGVRSFAVFFDDIGGIGTSATRQGGYMNYLQQEFVEKKPDVAPLIFCPTQYNQSWAKGSYLDTLGTLMNPDIRILWTGKKVVAMIDKETLDWVNTRIRRNAYIWYNYPVTDYAVDRLLMGPVAGNGNDIAAGLSGFVANPMEYAEASKVALFGIADYLWNMKPFNAVESWNKSLRYLFPKDSAAFKVFAENNIDLGPTGHRLRLEGESPSFREPAAEFLKSWKSGSFNEDAAKKLTINLKTIIGATKTLENSTDNIPLREEIKPWLQVLRIISEKGIATLQMAKALRSKDSVGFIKYLGIADALQTAQQNIFSRKFKGSIKSPNPRPAQAVIDPFISQLRIAAVKEYKKRFRYRLNALPKYVLEDGKYFLKVNGGYLSNAFGQNAYPVLTDYRDSINPQRQEWFISLDAETGRYKLVNAQDNRYLNELGEFGSNSYSSNWNTYIISRKENLFSIQNAGEGGKKFWMVQDGRIGLNPNTKAPDVHYVFEIEAAGK